MSEVDALFPENGVTGSSGPLFPKTGLRGNVREDRYIADRRVTRCGPQRVHRPVAVETRGIFLS